MSYLDCLYWDLYLCEERVEAHLAEEHGFRASWYTSRARRVSRRVRRLENRLERKLAWVRKHAGSAIV